MALTPQEVEALSDLGFTLDAYAALQIGVELMVGGVLGLLALFLFFRSFDSTQGVLVTFMLALLGLNFMVETDTAFVEHYTVFLPLHGLFTAMPGVAFILFLFVFPDGRFTPRWTRIPFVFFLLISLAEPLVRPGRETPSAQYSYLYLFGFIFALLLGLAAQVYRYRYISTPGERQQTKWVLAGLATLIAAILIYALFVEISPIESGSSRVLFNTIGYGAMALTILVFPISMVISILRYRLWDVDIIIRRTLVYAALTALLALVYFGVVVLLQSLFRAVTGQDSALAIVLSTLAIAALFAPLRRRIQFFFDRRFYRRNYDAARALARFSRTARDEVDLDTLTSELAGVVTETVQPEHVSLWLRDGSLVGEEV